MSLEDVAVVIDNNKVYASYYAMACRIVPNNRLVSISVGVPDNFKGSLLRELNPPSKLLYEYKNNIINENEYALRYTKEILDRLDPMMIYNSLKGKVMLCYCGAGKFCHRTLVLNWLRENVGNEYIGGEI